ncbi:MAG TPA: immune inhibitor A domain-containing protein [Microlunatus sp.]|nr:immune inhibitor A domain-containing protein [Microlunatus sp.]
MRRAIVGTLGLTLTTGLLVAMGSTAQAQPDDGHTPPTTKPSTAIVDDLPNPQEEKRRELRKAALSDVLSGRRKAVEKGGSTVVKIATKAAPTTKAERARARAGKAVKQRNVDQYVELSRETTDRIFVVLAEFGNERHPSYPDQDTDPDTPGPTVFDGPLHNAIPEPDRSRDNRTIWQADYSAEHYRQLYFGEGAGVQSLKTYYEKQSSGRYSVDGQVTDWVKVPYNEARYGRSGGYPCAGNVCSNTWALLRDALNSWVVDQEAQGRTDTEIAADVKSFDKWDRNDFDGDGIFNEPDGYIDHFQIVHAGGDEADSDPYQAEDAIWSHRWKAFQGTGQGPAGNPDGGVQIGTTGVWVADYTIQPENGGLSVFAHEYGHDLGLPDLYDTSGGDDGVAWWSLMSQSRASAKKDEGIGTRPADLGAWEKLQLGWFDYELAKAGNKRTYQLGPHEYNSDKPQGLVVALPQKSVETDLPDPTAGEHTWWSGSGDDLDNTLTRQVTVPAGAATLSFQANYNIEDCGPDPCDYAYVEVDDGSGFAAVPGNIAAAAEGNGIDGDSNGWTPAMFDLSAYAGKTVGLRIRYLTDGAAQGTDPDKIAGIFLDEIKLTAGATTVFEDGAENGNNGWTPSGFTVVATNAVQDFDNYYIASNRTYRSYDRYLRTGPYNFGWTNTKPAWVEHFPYQNGLLVSYWDTSQSDNNTNQHNGEGLILPVDAHPDPLYRLDSGGAPWRNRVQLYDATFGTERADSFYLHFNGQRNWIRGQAAQPLFDDTKPYWNSETPSKSVKLPGVGVTLKVIEENGTGMTVRLGTSSSGPQAAGTR